MPIEADDAAIRPDEARDHVEDRGLAGAVRAEQADRLAGVSTPAAGSVRLLDEAGAPSPDGIELPAGGQVEAVSEAVRMQLEGVTAPIAPTDTVPVTFTFATAGEVQLDVPVTAGPGPVD